MVIAHRQQPAVVVIGLGLIGGSLAKLLVKGGHPVVGWDPDPGTRAAAATAGVTVPETLAEAVRARPDLIVVAVPLRAVAQTMAKIADLIDDSVTITDVGSVKRQVRDAAVAAGLQDQYVGAHPMAGTELSGFAAAEAELLDDITWAVTITATTDVRHAARVLHLITKTARSRALVITDQEHDEAVARISHLPHVLATELLAIAGDAPVAGRLAAGSFRDGTRVARHGATRSQAMIEANRDVCAELVRQASHDLARLADDLAQDRDTDWFFSRGELPASDERHFASATIAWTGDWRAEAIEAGSAGRAVVSITAEHLVIESA
ncbi:prephenate dehydrogenase [Micrococcales bacterium KH10]|nr:prephenate dehydrogenase [Micrococcales bacterium KH10]